MHHGITAYNDKFDYMDSVMLTLAIIKSQCKEDLFFTVKFAQEKLSKCFTAVTPMTGMLLISVNILNSYCKFWSIVKWHKEMDVNSEVETLNTTQ